MAHTTFNAEYTSSIAQPVAVEALVQDKNLSPDEVPRVIKKISEETKYSQGTQYKSVKNVVEAMDEDNFTYSHSTAKGDTRANTFEKISHKVKITALPEGGSVWKNTSKYFTDGEVEVTEEKIKAVKQEATGMFRAVLDYAEANPED